MGKVLITPYKDGYLSALHDGNRVLLMDYVREARSVRAGSIYRAKVNTLSPNIQAAFLELAPGVMGYLPYDPKDPDRPRPGQELNVQVEKEAVKTKLPVLNRALNMPGKLLVLTAGKTVISFSHKIQDEARKDELRTILTPLLPEDAGFIVRTNAEKAENGAVLMEAALLSARYKTLQNKAEHAPVHSLLYEAEAPYIRLLKNLRESEWDEVVTDDETVFADVRDHLWENQPQDAEKLRLYNDPQLSLIKLYSLETELERALDKKVWLKSGGYLIIEYTEALTVIDVNTGKFDGKKNFEDSIFKVNKEAAEEIPLQLRLRNLSGIIMVDFINMKEKAREEELLEILREAVKQDPVKTEVIDMTALGIAELTRRKIAAPLHETIR